MQSVFIAVWNVGIIRLFRVDQRSWCLRKERLTWCTVTFQSQICTLDPFSTAQAAFRMCLIWIKLSFFSPSELGFTYLFHIFLRTNELRNSWTKVVKLHNHPLNKFNLAVCLKTIHQKGENTPEKHLWVYVFFQHLLNEFSWLCMLNHLKAHIKEIWHTCKWFVGRDDICAQIWANFLYSFIALHS